MHGSEYNEEQEMLDELSELTELRQFQGAPTEFWGVYISVSTRLIGAEKGVLLLKDEAREERYQTRKIAEHPPGASRNPAVAEFLKHWGRVLGDCGQKGSLVEPLKGNHDPNAGFMVAMRLRIDNEQQLCVAAYALLGVTRQQAEEALMRLRLTADVPKSYQVSLSVLQAQSDVRKLATVMDVMVEVNAARKFLEAALAFCNGVATRFRCDRVSLGWLEGGFVRLKAISRTEKFDKHMEAVRKLEVAMEECLDQDDEVIWPEPGEASVVTRDHEAFSKDQQAPFICSLPIRCGEEAAAVLTCERGDEAFSELEVQQLRLACDQSARLLDDLHHRNRWFGARWTHAAREKLSWLIGPEHTWAKIFSLIGVVLLACLIFLKVPYRVEAEFILRSDDVAFLTAPFGSYIDEVNVRQGDTVEAGEVLISLNKADLYLQEAQTVAEMNRHLRETEKARAGNKLAEMRVAEALADQARASLELVRYRLAQADIKAPFAGVVVEGDPGDRIGAAVEEGEALFRVARTDTLYVEGEVDERDVHEIVGVGRGEIAFVSRPALTFPVTIERVESAAMPKEEGNVFQVRAGFPEGIQEWWRPGMSGLMKIEVGDRTLLWIFTHRTVDFLRLWLWW